MRLGPPLLLATTFAFLLAATAATLLPTARTEAAAPTRPAGARTREAPAPASQVHSLFLAGHYAAAYGRYAALADAGDPAAAAMALAMVVNGPTLFGSDWSATGGQLQRWSALARQVAAQSEVSIAAQDRGE